MRKSDAVFTAVIFTTALAAPLFAHHSVSSQFDSTRTTTISGMVTKIDWANPHVWIYLTVNNGNQTIPWRVQIAGPGALKQAGIDKGMIDLAKPITLEVWPAYSDEIGAPRSGTGRTLTLQGGQKLDVSDKWPQGKGPN
jgi:hypothetical protein